MTKVLHYQSSLSIRLHRAMLQGRDYISKGADSNEIKTASQSLKVWPKIGKTEIRQSTNKRVDQSIPF